MNLAYHPISSSSPGNIPVSIGELATNVITDWMPGTPVSLSRGFADLLGEILESQSFNIGDFWTVRRLAARYEKQWKQVTSFILGVACCRKVVEMEGYPWWAPVSAFTRRNNVLSVLTPNWVEPYLPIRHCRVQPPDPPLSNLLPDYVLARLNRANSNYEISFAESKGSQSALESLRTPPAGWRNQSRNAEFFYRDVRCHAAQNLIVATRVNPAAKKPWTRLLRVRAWNSNNLAAAIPFEAARDVLSLHYLGVCERIGLVGNAKLLQLNRLHRIGVPLPMLAQFSPFSDTPLDQLKVIADDEMERQKSDRLPQGSIFFAAKRPFFSIGARTLRVGVSEEGLNIIHWLQEDGEHEERVIHRFNDEISRLRSSVEGKEGIVIRLDGIIGEFID
ncbi:MAG: hypothetical protein ACLQVJ_11580 [Syntrophobacteraceae bacterium]